MAKEVLVAEEKHGDIYYLLASPEDKNAVALSLLRERAATGYYYPSLAGLEEQRQEILNTPPRDSAAALPYHADLSAAAQAEIAAKDAEEHLKYQARHLRALEGDLTFARNLEKLLALPVAEALALTYTTRRGRELPLALSLLEERSDGEYEGFRIETLQEAPKE
jgi:hypothetical protein